MAKNDGKVAEAWFEAHFASFGKQVMMHVFEDMYQARFKTGKGALTKAQPADYLITENGITLFAEVKSSENVTSFPFSDIRTSQWQTARKQVAAKGEYDFFILNLTKNAWYRVPAKYLLEHKDSGFRSIKWKLLTSFEWFPVVDKPTT